MEREREREMCKCVLAKNEGITAPDLRAGQGASKFFIKAFKKLL